MKCKDVEKVLIFYLDGELPEEKRLLVLQHINQCAGCAAKLHFLEESFQVIDSEKLVEVNPFLYTRIKARMEKQPEPVIRRWVLVPLAAVSVLAAGLFMGVLVGKLTQSQPRLPSSAGYQVSALFDDTQMESTAYKLMNDQPEIFDHAN